MKFWRDPVLRDLEMLHATYVTYSFSRHAHEGFGIAIVQDGAMSFDYRGSTYTAPAGSIVVTQPGEMHTGQAAVANGWTYRTLLPATDWLQQAVAELTEKPGRVPYFASPVIHDRRLNQQLVHLHKTLERPDAKPIGKEHLAIAQVQDYLHSQYVHNISLGELAALVNLKPLRLLRAFRKQIGLPPHAYLNHVRIREAKRLLIEGWSITDAALETGFTDQSHLHRHFKKMIGVTPGQYVRGCKNVQSLKVDG